MLEHLKTTSRSRVVKLFFSVFSFFSFCPCFAGPIACGCPACGPPARPARSPAAAAAARPGCPPACGCGLPGPIAGLPGLRLRLPGLRPGCPPAAARLRLPGLRPGPAARPVTGTTGTTGLTAICGQFDTTATHCVVGTMQPSHDIVIIVQNRITERNGIIGTIPLDRIIEVNVIIESTRNIGTIVKCGHYVGVIGCNGCDSVAEFSGCVACCVGGCHCRFPRWWLIA